jgi:hypothetical protein
MAAMDGGLQTLRICMAAAVAAQITPELARTGRAAVMAAMVLALFLLTALRSITVVAEEALADAGLVSAG